MYIMNEVQLRLAMFGYESQTEDDGALKFAIGKAKQGILDDCNIDKIPSALKYMFVDRAVGEFLFAKRATGGDDLLSGVNLDMIASQIKEGDATVAFGSGSDITPSARFDALVQALRTCGKGQLARYRRLTW